MDRSARRFRFSLAAHEAADRPRTFTPEGWRELARKTEALGYCTLHVADHYLDRGRAPQFLAPIAAMATAAAVTTTLRIGSRVFCIDYHVPAALAKEAATLDYLSEGRLELGLGAGWSQVEYESMGLVFEAPPRRISRLEEVVALMKAHFSGEEMDCRGRSVHVGGYKGLPPPVQQPRPRLMIGGGKKRVLSLAAREADIVSFSNTPFAPRNETGQTPHDVAVERLGFVESAAGNRLPALEIESSPYFTAITDDRSQQEAALRVVADRFGVPPEGLREHPNVLVGSESEIVERLQFRREHYGVHYVAVPESQTDAFAPIAARLTGT